MVGCVHPAAVLRDAALLPELERACRKFARLFKELTGNNPGPYKSIAATEGRPLDEKVSDGNTPF